MTKKKAPPSKPRSKKPTGRPRGNPNIKEVSKKTQFKKGNTVGKDPGKDDIRPWDIRKELRYLAAQKIDPEKLDQELKRITKDPANKYASVGRMVAIRMIEKTIKKMEPAMVNSLIENTCGKQSQEIIIPNRQEAPEDFQDLDAAARAYQEFIKA